MQTSKAVQNHYGLDDLVARVAAWLTERSFESGKTRWQDLAGLDQFHVRGLAATAELADLFAPEPGSTILDIGCGLGGPSRYLAAAKQCDVVGIDLSASFVAVANMLTRWSDLGKRARFEQADATNLPFSAESFEGAWTQHVAMNIHDRAKLYSEIHRVLRPAAKLAIYDVVAGNGTPLHFPVPWASSTEISFLIDTETMRGRLSDAGFETIVWLDVTEKALDWFARETPQAGASNGGLELVMGPLFPTMAANLSRNLKEGKVRLVQTVQERVSR